MFADAMANTHAHGATRSSLDQGARLVRHICQNAGARSLIDDARVGLARHGVIAAVQRHDTPAIFDWLQRAGNVADAEMHRVFNCGIGMVVVVAAADAERAMQLLAGAGESVFRIGAVVPRAPGAPATVVV